MTLTDVKTADLAASLRIGVARLSRRIRVERAGDDLTFNQLSVLGTLSRYGSLLSVIGSFLANHIGPIIAEPIDRINN